MFRNMLRYALQALLDQLGETKPPKHVIAELSQVYLRLGALEGKLSIVITLMLLTLGAVLSSVVPSLLR